MRRQPRYFKDPDPTVPTSHEELSPKKRRQFRMTIERRAKIIERLRAGCTRTAACQSVGISYDTLLLWLKNSEPFATEVQQAEADAEVRMTTRIAAEVVKPDGDWRAALEWLKRRRPQDWGERLQIIKQIAQDVREASTADLLEFLGYDEEASRERERADGEQSAAAPPAPDSDEQPDV